MVTMQSIGHVHWSRELSYYVDWDLKVRVVRWAGIVSCAETLMDNVDGKPCSASVSADT